MNANMNDCLFCKIAAGEIPSNKLYEDDQVVAFYDLNPLAPVHFLVVPKAHIESAAQLSEDNAPLLGHIFAVIARLTNELGCENGYRVVTNAGEDAGQTVKHLHFHVLAKAKLGGFGVEEN
jgi:histidine triad (HIT) family protein